MNWIVLAHHRNRCWDIMNSVINLRVRKRQGFFLYLSNYKLLRKDSTPRSYLRSSLCYRLHMISCVYIDGYRLFASVKVYYSKSNLYCSSGGRQIERENELINKEKSEKEKRRDKESEEEEDRNEERAREMITG